jgi:hypothetical protein
VRTCCCATLKLRCRYTRVTGTTQLPPMFAIAYHQCRWNYKNEEDVYSVDAMFEELDFPYDVLWLDIEHTDGAYSAQARAASDAGMRGWFGGERGFCCPTQPNPIQSGGDPPVFSSTRRGALCVHLRTLVVTIDRLRWLLRRWCAFLFPGTHRTITKPIGKRYFTWDKNEFPNPKKMIDHVASKGRKMVTIVDPHIKIDARYHVHKEATEKGLYIKDKTGKDFDGWCWYDNDDRKKAKRNKLKAETRARWFFSCSCCFADGARLIIC